MIDHDNLEEFRDPQTYDLDARERSQKDLKEQSEPPCCAIMQWLCVDVLVFLEARLRSRSLPLS